MMDALTPIIEILSPSSWVPQIYGGPKYCSEYKEESVKTTISCHQSEILRKEDESKQLKSHISNIKRKNTFDQTQITTTSALPLNTELKTFDGRTATD